MKSNEPFNNPIRLSQATLTSFASRLSIPAYRPEHLSSWFVPIGVGGFPRSHQAFYLKELAPPFIIYRGGGRGVGLLPADEGMAQALSSQDCLYTLVAREA